MKFYHRFHIILFCFTFFSIIYIFRSYLFEDVQKLNLEDIKHLQCDLFFSNLSSPYTQQFKNKRWIFEDPDVLPMDCKSIRSRHYFPSKPASQEEKNFPIAQIRLVHKDYFLIEMDFASAYATQNKHCYAIDKKADNLFRSRVKALEKCFPNVYVTRKEYEMDSSGHGIYNSIFECFKLLSKQKWKYVQVLQNHEITLRPNREKVQILKWLNGSNDISQNLNLLNRIPKNPGWSFSSLNLFKNKSRNTMTEITITKGFIYSSLSREFVDFIMRELDLTLFIEELEKIDYGADEFLFSTLNTFLAAPGGTTFCHKEINHITSYSMWKNEVNARCSYWRHWVCIYRVAELAPVVEELPHMYVNKMMPEIDFAALACWYKHLYNITYVEKPRQLNELFYKNLTNVRLQKLKNKDGVIDLKLLESFNGCN